MGTVANIIVHEQPDSGVYWVGSKFPEEEITTIRKFEFCKLYHIKGAQIHILQNFLDEAQIVMGSTDDCTYSLDTFLDCMRGIEPLSSPINLCVFLYDNIEVFAENSLTDFQTLLKVFHYATDTWRRKAFPKRMYVLLAGNKDYVDAILPLKS